MRRESGRTCCARLYGGCLSVALLAASLSAGEIRGFRFEDLNRNGNYDPGEPGIGNAPIWADSNGNGRVDPGEPAVLTDSTGAYALTGLSAGRYFVGALPQTALMPVGPQPPSLLDPVFILTRGGPRVFVAEDLNNDGYLDLVTSNNYEKSISVALSGPGGTFGLATHYDVDRSPRFVLAGDFNEDGWKDLAVSNQRAGNISVLLNNGDGTFGAQTLYPCDDESFMIASGDFNEDGHLDLVVINQFGNSVTQLDGAGDGTFTVVRTFFVGLWPHDIVVEDIDRDGHLDIAVTNFLVRSVALIWGRGDGTFEENEYLAVGDRPLHSRIADLDKDGHLDIVVDNRFSNNVMVMYGDGQRNFTPAAVYPTGEQTHDVSVADVNQDGWLDLVVVGYLSNDVTVYLNTGLRDFELKGIYNVGGTAPLFAMPVDLNEDGAPDLAVNNYESGTITTLLNAGDGSFAHDATYNVGPDPRSMILADIDLNGRIDVVTAAMQNFRIAILYNLFGRRIVTLAQASDVIQNVDFGQRRLTGQSEPPSGGNSFKVRVGETQYQTVTRNVAVNETVWPVKVSRTSGEGTKLVSVRAVLVEGDPNFWDVSLSRASVLLGPPPTRSRADVNKPGILLNRLGDGAVDDDDLAIFEGCFTGDGVSVSAAAQGDCIQLDLDGDLDIDDDDRAILLDEWTGPRPIPWQQVLELRVQPKASVPHGSIAKVQIFAEEAGGGEEHSVFAYARRVFYDPGISPIQRVDFTVERSEKPIFARDVRFDLAAFSKGAASDVINVSVEPVPGFTFTIRSAATLQPQTSFPTAPVPESPSFPGSIAPIYLDVRAPANWPRGSEATIRVTATSANGGMSNSYDLKVLKVGALWCPSDLLLPDGRRHRAAPGSNASFGFQLMNPLPQARTLTVTASPIDPADLNGDEVFDLDDFLLFAGCFGGPDEPPPPGCDPQVFEWCDSDHDGDVDLVDFAEFAAVHSPGTMEFSQTQFTLQPGQSAEFSALLNVPATARPGGRIDWAFRLFDGQTLLASSRVGARVDPTPKVIYTSIDALAPEYMYLNAAGTGPGAPGDWLMPNVQAFMQQSTTYSGALSDIPSATDHNQVGAMTGSHLGTSGIGCLVAYYYGRQADGISDIRVPSTELLRHGEHGDEVLSLFDVARQVDPLAYSAYLTGKWWVDNYVVGDKPSGGGSLSVDGGGWPYYCPAPEPHTIGDPPSDDDAALDPPLPEWIANWGTTPGLFPSDRWVMESSLKMLTFEDPDVMFILLAGVDDAGHMMGGAWNPSDWDTRGTPSTWDDVHLTSPRAVREDKLDEVREADAVFGMLLDELDHRDLLDRSYLVLLSDHGMISVSPHRADVMRLLESNGYNHKDDFVANAGGPIGYFFGIAEDREAHFEWVLENSPSIVPGYETNPWVIINQQEMLTGIDAHTGIQFSDPGEMYSEYFVEHTDGQPDVADWPDFLILFLDDAQIQPMHFEPVLGEENDLNGDAFQGGHGFFATQPNVLVISGPRVPAGQVVPDTLRSIDAAPTLYRLLGWPTPAHVDGAPLPGIDYPKP